MTAAKRSVGGGNIDKRLSLHRKVSTKTLIIAKQQQHDTDNTFRSNIIIIINIGIVNTVVEQISMFQLHYYYRQTIDQVAVWFDYSKQHCVMFSYFFSNNCLGWCFLPNCPKLIITLAIVIVCLFLVKGNLLFIFVQDNCFNCQLIKKGQYLSSLLLLEKTHIIFNTCRIAKQNSFLVGRIAITERFDTYQNNIYITLATTYKAAQ